MIDYALELYRQMFSSIKRGNFRGQFSNAKPIFLYSIIEYIGKTANIGMPVSNKFLPDNKVLREIYRNAFELFGIKQKTNFIQPFFHLESEPFYEMEWRQDKKPSSNSVTPSLNYIRENLICAKLDDNLWQLLQQEHNREYLKNVLITTYLS